MCGRALFSGVTRRRTAPETPACHRPSGGRLSIGWPSTKVCAPPAQTPGHTPILYSAPRTRRADSYRQCPLSPRALRKESPGLRNHVHASCFDKELGFRRGSALPGLSGGTDISGDRVRLGQIGTLLRTNDVNYGDSVLIRECAVVPPARGQDPAGFGRIPLDAEEMLLIAGFWSELKKVASRYTCRFPKA